MKSYSSYKDSGVEWIGEIPKKWEIKPLFSECYHTKEPNLENNANVLSLSYGRIIKRDIESNFGLLPDSFNNYQLLRHGYVVLRLMDLQNDKRSLRVGFCEDVGIITSVYLSLNCSDSVKNKFLYYQLHSADLKKVFYTLGGGLRQTLRFDEFKRFPLIFPSLKEQQQISNYLDTKTQQIDELIEKTEQTIELLKEKKTSLINHCVTKGLDPNVEMKDSGVEWIGEIPRKWERKKLNQICTKVRNGYVGPTREIMKDDGVKYIQGIHIKNGEIIFTPNGHYYVTKEWSEKHSESILQEGDVLVVQTGTIGNVGYVESELENSNCHALIIVRIDPNIGIGKFLLYYFMGNYVQNYLQIIKTGEILYHINTKKLRPLDVLVPPLPEQQQIVTYLNQETQKIDTLIEKENKRIDLLKEYCQSLISEVVTGKIDVRNEVLQ